MHLGITVSLAQRPHCALPLQTRACTSRRCCSRMPDEGSRPQAYKHFKKEKRKEAAEWRGPLLPVSSIPPAVSSIAFHASTKLCATVLCTGLREPEQVETHPPNTTAARESLSLSVTVLCQFKSVEPQPQPDHAAGKSYRVFVDYDGKSKKLKTTSPNSCSLVPRPVTQDKRRWTLTAASF